MKQNKKASKQTKVSASKAAQPAVFQTGQDVRSAVLVVSVFINLFLFTGWLIAQTTNQYNDQIVALIFK
jgi:hypothetical protein